MAGEIEAFYLMGDDALANEWEIVFPPFPGVIDLANSKLRVTQLTLPAQTKGTYEVDYKGRKITKPNGKIETTGEVTFTFRVDKNWNVYRGFSFWLNLIGDNKTGLMAPDMVNGVSAIRVPLTVYTVNSAGIPTGGNWTLDGAFITNLSTPAFDMSSGDALTCDVTLQITRMITL